MADRPGPPTTNDDETPATDPMWVIADRLFAAIEVGDLDGVRAVYDDEVRVWSNVDPRELDRERSLKLLRWLTSRMTDRHYEIRRRERLPDGFLQEHVLRGTAPDGTAIAMPACLVVQVRDGRITRIHEYLDPSQVVALSR